MPLKFTQKFNYQTLLLAADKPRRVYVFWKDRQPKRDNKRKNRSSTM